MSQSAAKKFMDRLDKDPKLQSAVRGAFNKIHQVAKKHGFKFTSTELRKHLGKRWGIKKPPKFDDPDTCCTIL